MKEKESSIQNDSDWDPDAAPDLTRDVWPEKFAVAKVRRGRPASGNPKVPTTIRLSREVIDYFRADGRGWQTRVNDALRDWIEQQKTAP